MKDPNEILRILRPLFKRWYIIVACLSLGLWLSFKGNNYRNPVYESTAVIKLDNTKHGISDQSLYENFDIFSAKNKTANEVELIMSKGLIIKTLEKLDFNITYHRAGKLKKLELYKDRPFFIEVTSLDSTLCNKPFLLNSYDGKEYLLSFIHNSKEVKITKKFGEAINLPFLKARIIHNPEVINKPEKLFLLKGKFEIKMHTYEALASQFTHKMFFVRSPDKEMDIIYMSYKHEVPEKAMKFVNAHARTYIEDGVNFREHAAKNTVSFIMGELDLIDKELKASEAAIEYFKRENNIINPKQETQANIDKLTQMELQKVNYGLKDEALVSISEYLAANPENAHLSPNYESVLDPLFIERLSKFNSLKLERQEMLLKYKKSNPIIVALDEKIESLKHQVSESIKNTRHALHSEMQHLESEINKSLAIFAGYPEKERQLLDLERQFRLNEKIYSFLSEKKIEAELMGKASISFHRVISKAELPTASISPGRSFIMLVTGALSLIIGVFIAYALDYFNPVVCSWHELETYTKLPVIGEVPLFSRKVNETAFSTIAASLMLKRKLNKGTKVSISSSVPNEGKSFTAYHLAKSIAGMGWKVLLIDFDLINPQLYKVVGGTNETGITSYLKKKVSAKKAVQTTDIENLHFLAAEKAEDQTSYPILHELDSGLMDQLCQGYDLVVFDTAPAGMVIDALPVMKQCHLNLYLIRANSTNRKLLFTPALIMDEYDVKNIELILNGTKNESSYTGYYPRKAYGMTSTFQDLWVLIKKKISSRA